MLHQIFNKIITIFTFLVTHIQIYTCMCMHIHTVHKDTVQKYSNFQ